MTSTGETHPRKKSSKKVRKNSEQLTKDEKFKTYTGEIWKRRNSHKVFSPRLDDYKWKINKKIEDEDIEKYLKEEFSNLYTVKYFNKFRGKFYSSSNNANVKTKRNKKIELLHNLYSEYSQDDPENSSEIGGVSRTSSLVNQ